MSDVERYAVDHPQRRKLPRIRQSTTYKFALQDLEVYMQVGLYEDGTPGEIFLTPSSKHGTLLTAFVDALSVAVSMGLQYGVPLEALCSKYIDWKFEPAGVVEDEDIEKVQSILDYMFRRLALDYLTPEQQRKVGVS